jgi:hypothetical protein
MRCLALACDYDGTLAKDGCVAEATLSALKRLKASGRKLLLVTGRELPELLLVFPDVGIFDCAAVENGALLYDPAMREETLLAAPPPNIFLNTLRERSVQPLSTGRVIVATLRPQADTVREAIRDSKVDLQLVFNKESLMVLPTGVDKATGLAAALATLELSSPNVAGIGDAENDLGFLAQCGWSAAVDNALDLVKEQVDIVTRGARGEGVAELIEMILSDDLQSVRPRNTSGRPD